MALEEYRRKRRFEATPEPPPKVEKKAGKALGVAGDKIGDLIPRVDADCSFCIEEIIELIIDVAADSEHQRGQASRSEPKAKSPNHPLSKHVSPAKQNP